MRKILLRCDRHALVALRAALFADYTVRAVSEAF
jgi:hypothetical protein